MKTLRVFLAHPKAWSPDEVDEAKSLLFGLLWPQWANEERSLTITTGREDFDLFARHGWNAWTYDVPSRYDLMVSTTERVGKATADILSIAASRGLPVFYWSGESIRPVGQIRCVSSSYVDGWVLELG